MMFSSTRFWVAIAVVATASCAWSISDFLGSNSCDRGRTAGNAPALPAVNTELVGKRERISYHSQTNTHFFHDVSEGLYYTYFENGFSFRPDGRQVAETEECWQVNLSVKGIRRAGHQLESRKPVVSLAPTDMFIDAGAYAVEYTRTEEGMRQNFYIREQLPGDGPLTVELACDSELEMYLAGEDDLLFAEPGASSPIACYRDLHVWDAAGRVLESHMELADNTVRLVVDDTDALYPVTVDPLISALWAALGGQNNEKQGWSVAGGRDVNSDGYEDILVGSPYCDYGGNSDVGCVRLYLGTATGVSTAASCTVYGSQANACFGWSVAFAGDVNNDGYEDVIIGAPLYDYTGAADAGRAFVFYGNSNGIAASEDWAFGVSNAGARLGTSVASAGNVDGDNYDDVIIGAPGYSNGQNNEGRAYVFNGMSSGLNSSYSWMIESNQSDAAFGFSVSSAGDVNGDGYSEVIVGAPKYSNGHNEEGGAFLYAGSAYGLGSTACWTADSNQGSAEFGNSVACAGDINNDGYADVVVGAPRYDHGQTNEGKIYLYLGGSGGLASTEVWTAESNQNNAYMGWSVASAGDVDNDGYDDIMTGAPYYDGGLRSDAGRVVIYGGNSTGVPASIGTFEGESAGDLFGYSIAGAGKVNNNNFDDVVVGSPSCSAIYSDGGKTSILDDPDLIYSKGSAGGNMPVSLIGAAVYPNPCRTGETTVEFDLPESNPVAIEVLDYTGAVVYSRNLGLLAAGRQSAEMSLPALATGVYVVRVTAGAESSSVMMRVNR